MCMYMSLCAFVGAHIRAYVCLCIWVYVCICLYAYNVVYYIISSHYMIYLLENTQLICFNFLLATVLCNKCICVYMYSFLIMFSIYEHGDREREKDFMIKF